MYNGDPKLVASDKTCYKCQQLFKNIVETWAVYNFDKDFYICEKCTVVVAEEKRKIEQMNLLRKQKEFEENRDYIAKDLGWHVPHDNDDHSEHPIKADKAFIENLLPADWHLIEDELFWMCKYMGKDTHLFEDHVSISNSSVGYDDNSMYDICKIVADVRKYVNKIKESNDRSTATQ